MQCRPAPVESRPSLDISGVLRLAVDAGQIVMVSGGETYRAQDIFARIARACGMAEAVGFIIPTGIIATVTDPAGNTLSATRLLPHRSIHLEKVARVNAIVEALEAQRIHPLDARSELTAIHSLKKLPLAVTLSAAGAVAAFFMLLVGGQWIDFPVAFAIGMLLRLGLEVMELWEIPSFFANATGGLLASVLAFTAVHFGLAIHADRIITGVIMLLVPGVSIVNAIRDTLTGDLVAGVSRATEAFVMAVAIALGTGLGFKLCLTFY